MHERRLQRTTPMSEPSTSNRSSAIAAAIILGGTGLVFYFMPAMMVSLSEISPWLSYALAIFFVLAFFAVFWLRGRAAIGVWCIDWICNLYRSPCPVL